MGSARLRFTDAKARLSSVFDDVVQRNTVRVVERQKSPALVFLELDDLAELLAKDFPFTTRMTRSEAGEMSIWLDQFDVYGRGEDIPAALDDLLDEIEDYVEEWEEELHRAPNHADRQWWVRRIQMAADRDEVRSIIFPVPSELPAVASPRPVATAQ